MAHGAHEVATSLETISQRSIEKGVVPRDFFSCDDGHVMMVNFASCFWLMDGMHVGAAASSLVLSHVVLVGELFVFNLFIAVWNEVVSFGAEDFSLLFLSFSIPIMGSQHPTTKLPQGKAPLLPVLLVAASLE
jgi:hypothetical protein